MPSKIYYNSLVTWHFLSHNANRPEVTEQPQWGWTQDEEWWDACREKQRGLAGQQGQPWNATPPPMGWYFIHPRGLKGYSHSLLRQQIPRKMLLNIPTSPAFRAGECSETQSSGTVRSWRKPNQGSGAGLRSSTLTLLFVFQLLSQQQALITTTVTVIFLCYQRPPAGWTELPVHLWYTDFLCSFLMHSYQLCA